MGIGYATVSAKMPRRLKKLLDYYGIKPGPVARRALKEKVKRRVLAEAEETGQEARRESERHTRRGGSQDYQGW